MSQPTTLELSGHELLAYTLALEFISRGQPLNGLQPQRRLNAMSGRHWDANQWLQVLRPAYQQMIGSPPEPQP